MSPMTDSLADPEADAAACPGAYGNETITTTIREVSRLEADESKLRNEIGIIFSMFQIYLETTDLDF